MDRLLSLSQAARMVGVRRTTLQQHIQDGKLATFEGALRLSELMKLYPDAKPDRSGMLEKVLRIQDGALYKSDGGHLPDSESLAAEVHRLRLELGQARLQVQGYRELTEELKDRLYTMQEQCDRNQKAMLGALISWLVRKTHRQA
jgi:CDP-4-dehydro-6-deoxyglucose reductase